MYMIYKKFLVHLLLMKSQEVRGNSCIYNLPDTMVNFEDAEMKYIVQVFKVLTDKCNRLCITPKKGR